MPTQKDRLLYFSKIVVRYKKSLTRLPKNEPSLTFDWFGLHGSPISINFERIAFRFSDLTTRRGTLRRLERGLEQQMDEQKLLPLCDG